MQYLKERTNKEHFKNSFFETKILKGGGGYNNKKLWYTVLL